MPIRASTGAGYQRRPADALWGTAPRYSRRARAGVATHDDLMPTSINSHVLLPAPSDPRRRKYYGGSFALDGRFVAWLDEGPPPRAVREQQRYELHPTRWWRNPYLVQRLEATLGADGVRAVVWWYTLRAAFDHWYSDVWDGLDQSECDAQRAGLERTIKRHAATCCGGGHDVAWLERLAGKLQGHVWKTYYPSNRQRKQAS